MKNILKVAQALVSSKTTSKKAIRKEVLKSEGITAARTRAQKDKVNREVNRLSNKINEVKQNTTIISTYYEDLERDRKENEKRTRKEKREQKKLKTADQNQKENSKDKPFLGSEKEINDTLMNIGKFAKEIPDFVGADDNLYYNNVQYFQFNEMYNNILENMQNISDINIKDENGNIVNYGRDLQKVFERIENIYRAIMQKRIGAKKNTIDYPIYEFISDNGVLDIIIHQ